MSEDSLPQIFERPNTAPTEQDLQFMHEALKQAELAWTLGEVPVGAVLVSQNGLLSLGHNEREVLQDPTAHAEIAAIREGASRRGSWRLTGTTLYVTLEPCCMCIGAIIQARIDRLVFGAWDPKAGACGSLLNVPEERRFNHHVVLTSGVLEKECREILQSFFHQRRRLEPAREPIRN